MQRLQLDPALDFPTVEFLGNTGAAALPMALSLGLQAEPPRVGERFAMLGIGSGLNSIMLGTAFN
jgi:3-oxoacyl-[acyl-carrier-protein] synthase-3